jgi:hypothetical protein
MLRALAELGAVAFMGGALALDRGAGLGVMLSQPLVGACLAGAILNPGPTIELWALRIPLGVGILLQLLLTDAALPAAQRPYETGTAGVVGAAVAILSMERLHPLAVLPTGGLLWVVVGTLAGLLAALAGGFVPARIRAQNRADLPRADALAAAGELGGFEALYWWSVARVMLNGAAWSVAATMAGVGATLFLAPRLASRLDGGLIGCAFAGLLGAALAAAYHAHVRGRPGAGKWAVWGALSAVVLHYWLRGSGP